MTIALCPWKKIESTLFEKELLPVGPVTKWLSEDRQQLVDVKAPMLERIVSQFNKMKEVGVRVPVFKTHAEDPDNDRGTVEALEIKPNKKGVPSLFSKIRFANEEVAEKSSRLDVSVFLPPKFVDGKANTYQFPLRHVALTSLPVVPGLEPFQSVVFSYDSAITDEELDKLGVEEISYADEENLETADTGVDAAEEEEELSDADAMVLIASALNVDLSIGNQAIVDAVLSLAGDQPPVDADEELDALEASFVEPVQPPKESISFSAPILRQVSTARETILQGLVNERIISPAYKAKLAERYINDEAISFDLSAAGETTKFEEAIEMARELHADRPISTPPRRVLTKADATGKNDEDANLPATVRDAKRRAAAAAKQ